MRWVTSFMFLYFGFFRARFMYLIQAFWFAAVAARRDRELTLVADLRTEPLDLRLAHRLEVRQAHVDETRVGRYVGVVGQDLDALAFALLRAGATALGSLPEMMIAL